jgi:hypothetical protein
VHLLTEAVELRLAMSETDAQLEKNVGNFIVPVLLKLSSSSEVVRKKVCVYISLELLMFTGANIICTGHCYPRSHQ